MIVDDIARNRREIEALKASQATLLANMPKYVFSTTYNYRHDSTQSISIFFQNQEDESVPFAIINVDLNEDSISGYDYLALYNLRQLTSTNTASRGWGLDFQSTFSHDVTVNIQVIANVKKGNISVVENW